MTGHRGVTAVASVSVDTPRGSRQELGQGHVSMVNPTVKVNLSAMAMPWRQTGDLVVRWNYMVSNILPYKGIIVFGVSIWKKIGTYRSFSYFV